MRNTVMNFAAMLMGGLPFAMLAAVGVVFLTPSAYPSPPWAHVGHFADLPPDGTPVRVAVKHQQRDAWTRLPDRVVGYAFLRRLPSGVVVALRAHHDRRFHIPVVFDPQQQCFNSKCWIVRFDLDGQVIHDHQMDIEEGMEALPVRVSATDVFVRYEMPLSSWEFH